MLLLSLTSPLMANFRVIIIGCGPSGLTAAHVLARAGIDFVILEQRDNIFQDTGASLVFNPQSLRVLAQLGLLDRLKSTGSEIQRVQNLTHSGHQFNTIDAAKWIRRKQVQRSLCFPSCSSS
jgi:2-polyprenyl-6-methoxyphenol hydroxylase-like FAD-dependent oxidoreductase